MTNENSPPPTDALQKARWLMDKGSLRIIHSRLVTEREKAMLQIFPSIVSELERVTKERDAALKGYRGLREGLKPISHFFDNGKQTTEAKMAEDLLTSFPEIK